MQRRKPMEMNRTLEDRTCEVRLTQREKKIVDFIRENGDSFLNDTITDFSEKVGVSDATIVRFCKHLGYKGYQDFKLHAAREQPCQLALRIVLQKHFLHRPWTWWLKNHWCRMLSV